MQKIKIQPEQYAEGRAAYESGARTVQEAKKLNPYQGFGRADEHALYISWNRGWNEAKIADEEKGNA